MRRVEWSAVLKDSAKIFRTAAKEGRGETLRKSQNNDKAEAEKEAQRAQIRA